MRGAEGTSRYSLSGGTTAFAVRVQMPGHQYFKIGLLFLLDAGCQPSQLDEDATAARYESENCNSSRASVSADVFFVGEVMAEVSQLQVERGGKIAWRNEQRIQRHRNRLAESTISIVDGIVLGTPTLICIH